jgi:hypothetical protein
MRRGPWSKELEGKVELSFGYVQPSWLVEVGNQSIPGLMHLFYLFQGEVQSRSRPANTATVPRANRKREDHTPWPV